MGSRKGSIDMLSGLPDEILHHILSFLPTKSSLSTSVLAKKWRFLWAHVPNLQFDKHNFSDQTQPLDIINRVAMLHRLHEAKAKAVDTFSFRLSSRKACAYQLETLIIYLIKRCVRNLYLHFDYQSEDDIACTVPRLLFTCKTLVDLKLVTCGVIPSTGQLFLPSLKKLNLSYVEYEDDESLPHLLSGCPVLEKLIIRSDQYNPSSFTVSSGTIKTLNVNFSAGGDSMPVKTLIIDVPALIYLRVRCYDLEYVKSLTKTMTSLIGAEITLHNKNHTCDIDCTEHGRSIEFLSCLCHVSYLRISSVSDETLFDMVGTGSMPKFVNLTKLEFDATVDWCNVVKFLEVADNLEVLVITLYELPPYKEPKRVPPCMLSRLRTVKMYYFSASEDAFDLVRYILRSAQVLERMEISPTSRFSKVKFDALQRISMFERVSKSCQVA